MNPVPAPMNRLLSAQSGISAGDPVPFMRVASHTLRLPDGRRAGVAVGGRGVPLVLAHGFSLASGLYVQALSRLASMGFLVVAVDMAGHGTSTEVAGRPDDLDEYRRFMADVLDELGIRRSVLVGHSLGGRLMAELAAAEPERAVALVLVDAAVGSAWDDLAAFSRWAPPLLGLIGTTLAADLTKMAFWGGRQSSKLRALGMRQAMANAVAPWRLVPPAMSVLLAPSSTPTLRRLRTQGVETVVVHGDRDPLVPLAAARQAAAASAAELVVVHRASHSWPLEDPETFRAIFADLLAGSLGDAVAAAVAAGGGGDAMPPGGSIDLDAVERALCRPDALVLRLSPGAGADATRSAAASRYEWTRTPAPVPADGAS